MFPMWTEDNEVLCYREYKRAEPLSSLCFNMCACLRFAPQLPVLQKQIAADILQPYIPFDSSALPFV